MINQSRMMPRPAMEMSYATILFSSFLYHYHYYCINFLFLRVFARKKIFFFQVLPVFYFVLLLYCHRNSRGNQLFLLFAYSFLFPIYIFCFYFMIWFPVLSCFWVFCLCNIHFLLFASTKQCFRYFWFNFSVHYLYINLVPYHHE